MKIRDIAFEEKDGRLMARIEFEPQTLAEFERDDRVKNAAYWKIHYRISGAIERPTLLQRLKRFFSR